MQNDRTDELNNNQQKEKRKSNWWLEDSDFLKKSNFHDLYYLETVCRYISNMIKNIPIPVLTTYDPKSKGIYFSVGKIKKGFPLQVDISYYDYVTLVKRWLSQFFPSYEIEYEKEEEYSDDEIWKIVKEEKIKLNDALMLRKKIKVKEKGVIEKETRSQDEFILNVNGNRQIRITGTAYLPMSLSTFMSELKSITDSKEKRNFILDNSTFVKHLDDNKQELNIAYSGKQLLNFFKINFEDLMNEELIEIEPFIYKWGKFKIKFESLSLKNDCLEFYNKEMNRIKKEK